MPSSFSRIARLQVLSGASRFAARCVFQVAELELLSHALHLGHNSERDEMLREQLAKFLHDHHKRTEAGERRSPP